MGKSALQRLSSDEGQLFHLVIGHLLILGIWICAAALTELMQRTLGHLAWSVYLLLNVVMFVVLVFLLIGKCDKEIDKLIDLVERSVETPRRLQIGYIWLRKKFRAIESFVSAFFIALIAYAIAAGHVLSLGFEEIENFAKSTLALINIYGLFLVLLILASWVCGLFVGRQKGT